MQRYVVLSGLLLDLIEVRRKAAAFVRFAESMSLAILKLSYNNIGDPRLVGGICGAAFFVNEHRALTANHVLSRENYRPNDGYSRCQYWLVSRDGVIIPFGKDALIGYPEIGTTIITFDEGQTGVKTYKLSDVPPIIGEAVCSKGYTANLMMPVQKASWKRDGLVVKRVI